MFYLLTMLHIRLLFACDTLPESTRVDFFDYPRYVQESYPFLGLRIGLSVRRSPSPFSYPIRYRRRMGVLTYHPSSVRMTDGGSPRTHPLDLVGCLLLLIDKARAEDRDEVNKREVCECDG
jgi:hypothetical protein